jgi:gliding motility-associated-like protein
MKFKIIIFHFLYDKCIKQYCLHFNRVLKFMMVVLFVLYCQKGISQSNNIVWADSCTTESFYGKIISEGYSDFSQVHSYAGGDLILAGTIKGVFGQMEIAKNYCNILRIDAAGSLAWSKFIGITDAAIQVDLRAYASVVTSNGDIVVVLAVNAPPLSGNYVIRLNSEGAVVWQKRLPYLNNGLSSDTFKDIIETADGGFLITGSAITEGLFIKLHADGDLVWSKSIISGSTDITAVTEGLSAYYVAGNFSILSNGFSENFIAKADKNTGDIGWIKWISFSGTVPMTQITRYEFEHMNFKEGVIALTGNTRYNYTGPNRNAQIAVYVEENGNVISATRIENMEIEMDRANIFQGMLYDPYIKTGVQFHNSDSSDYYVFRLKDDNTATWAWRVVMPGAQSAKDIKVLNDSSVVIAGFSRNPGSNVSASLLKTSAAGRLENCINQPYQLKVSPEMVSLQDNSNVYESLSGIGEATASALDVINGNGFMWQLQCNSLNDCRISKIKGSSTVCKNETNVYAVIRNGNCGNPVTFSSDVSVSIIPASDSSVNISFPSAGTFMLYASMQAACGILKDSMMVQVKNSGSAFSLGTDTEICPGNKLTLRVSEGLGNYLWQDGSSDTVYTVTVPGRYYLTATGVCGQLFSDTIIIASAPPFEFSAGPDRVKCNADTVHINGPSGFYNYRWSPDYNISSVQNQNIIIRPLTDTFYAVVAEKYPGCLAYDTINIQVKNSPAIQLGGDTAICGNETLLLNAGTGFVSYLWNDGKTTAVNLIAQPGVYTVTGYYTNGCNSSDTVSIINNNCFNDIYIPNVFTPNNDGLNEMFKPVISHPLTFYQFQIFNQWGQILFETNDINKGWDGKFKEKKTETNVLVWICTYQLEGKKRNMKKGTVILMR